MQNLIFLWAPKLLHMEKQLYVQSQAKGEFIATLFWCPIRQVRSFVVQSLDETFRQPKIPSLKLLNWTLAFLSVVCILNYFKLLHLCWKGDLFLFCCYKQNQREIFLFIFTVITCNLIVIYYPSSHSQRSIHLQSTLIDLHLNFWNHDK